MDKHDQHVKSIYQKQQIVDAQQKPHEHSNEIKQLFHRVFQKYQAALQNPKISQADQQKLILSMSNTLNLCVMYSDPRVVHTLMNEAIVDRYKAKLKQ
jgi:hypothetical protein